MNTTCLSVKKKIRLDKLKSSAPSDDFDLDCWMLNLPINDKGELSGEADSKEVKEDELQGFVDDNYFFSSDDGGMVFNSPIYGATTSGSHYTRSELREMLRCGDTDYDTQGVGENNWVFSTAPEEDQESAGGVDGTLEATLSVNAVTSSGDSTEVGRVVIGQIHANDDEPLRIYYRKLPNNERGSLYFAHEWNSDVEENEEWIEIIGGRDDDISDPDDGIALDEIFSYRVDAHGNDLTVTITRDGHEDVSGSVDMSNSGYDVGGQYLFFKAGVYNQNSTGDADDYVQATFYSLVHSHS